MAKYLKRVVLLIGLLAAIGISVPTLGEAETKIQKKTPPADVELYVTSWCPYCKKAKDFFDQRGIAYRVYDIERDAAAARRKQQLDTGRGVPFAVINGIKLSGWSEQAYQNALEN